MSTVASARTQAYSRGYLICLAGTVIWSTTGILIRYLTENYKLPSLVLAFWRDAFVSITLAVVLAAFRPALLRAGFKHLRWLALYGFVLAVFNTLWTVSVAMNGAAVATVVVYSAPVFITVFGWRLFGERLTFFKIGLVLLSLLGCVFVSGAYMPEVWQVNPLGTAVALLSSLSFAAYSMFGKASAQRGLNSWVTLLFAFAFASLFLLGFNLIADLRAGVQTLPHLFWLNGSAGGWGVLLLLAVGPTIGGYGLYTLSLSYLPASIASLIATLEPPLTTLMAYLFLGERLTSPQWLGAALILGSVIILRLRPET
jgi:drug/metabolite transporter (DMT)-like permease